MCPDFGKFFHLAPENSDFGVFSHFCFLSNFLLKNQNKTLLVLEQPLRSMVCDFAFNSILLFLVKFDILPPNLMISVIRVSGNFLIILGFYFFSNYIFCSL